MCTVHLVYTPIFNRNFDRGGGGKIYFILAKIDIDQRWRKEDFEELKALCEWNINLWEYGGENHVRETAEEESCPVKAEEVEQVKEVFSVWVSGIETSLSCGKYHAVHFLI